MKRNQVALRKAKVRQRIEQLEEQKVRAGRDRRAPTMTAWAGRW